MNTAHNHEIKEIPLPDDYEGEVKATLIYLKARKPSATAVLYIHGYSDYYFQYHMGEYFSRQGKNFYALELRKYGRSWMPHQKFNYCRDMKEYYPEVDAAIDFIISEGNTDITMIGHSTGGLLAAIYSADGNRREFINRVILNSPFLEFNMGKVSRNIAIPVASGIGKALPNSRLAPRWNPLSKNYFQSIHTSQLGEWDYDLDLKPKGNPPLYFAWVGSVRKAHKEVKDGLHIRIPVMVMYSAKSTYHKKWHEECRVSDTILNVEDMIRYGQELGDNIQLEEITDGLHDLVLSRKDVREKVLTIMDYFISERRDI